MNFDIYAFWEVCIWIVPIIILVKLLISTFLGLAMRNPSYGPTICTAVYCLLSVGVMAHEAAHRLFCALFGVKVYKTRYFIKPNFEKSEDDGITLGYVSHAPIDSFIVSFFVGLAPLIINGLLVALLYYFAPVLMETSFYGVFIYLGVALAAEAKPSTPDIKNISHPFKRAPGRCCFEFLMLLLFVGVLCALFACEVELWISLSATVIFFVLLVLQGRSKTGASRVPKWRM